MIINEDVERARHIAKMTETEGWKELRAWIENRMSIINTKLLNAEDDILVEKVSTDSIKQKSKKIEITILNMSKDKNKHELLVWRMFLSQIADWERLAREGR